MKEHGYMIVLGLLTSFMVVLLTMPSLIKVARMKHLVDEPKEDRKLHQRSIPTIGGIIIFAAIIFSYSLWFPTAELLGDTDSGYKLLYLAMGEAFRQFKYILAMMVLLFFIGVKDDIVGFSPVKKLVGHLVVGYILVFMADIRITSMYGIFNIYELPDVVSIPFTFFTYIVLVNAFNLIDGVDGLAAGVGLIAATAFGSWFFLAGNIPSALLAAVLAGALLGFLFFNFNPARIFMGDSGSLIIGAILAVLAIQVIEQDTSRMPMRFRQIPTPLFAMSVLAYPLIDTFRVFFVRAVKGMSPFSADKNHIHHRLLKLGLGHKGTAGVLYVSSALVIGLSLFTQELYPTKSLLLLGAGAFVILMAPFLVPKRKDIR